MPAAGIVLSNLRRAGRGDGEGGEVLASGVTLYWRGVTLYVTNVTFRAAAGIADDQLTVLATSAVGAAKFHTTGSSGDQ